MELYGKAVSRGIVTGSVLRYVANLPQGETGEPMFDNAEAAIAAYHHARDAAYQELEALKGRLVDHQPDEAAILSAHQEILMDFALDDEICAMLQSGQEGPCAAVECCYEQFADLLSQSPSALMQERVSDLRDVKQRLLRVLLGQKTQDLGNLPQPVIVVADDLYPSDTVSLDRDKVLGIITQVGGNTSHTAIIARSYGIPAVLGVPNAMALLRDGETVVLDAVAGKILTEPTPDVLQSYAKLARDEAEHAAKTGAFLASVPVTLDGTRITVNLNIATVEVEELAGARYADGCGLFRTEFLYMQGTALPTEEEQFLSYQKILSAFEQKSVTLRTMDIGGDKQVPLLDLPKEENPFLGVRGLRLSLARPALFRQQLRAALRASIHGTLKITFPMVGSLDDLRAARNVVSEVADELDASGIAHAQDVQIGIMVEVPSIALIADLVAKEVDFISIGTNDLTQYLCAADRMNPELRAYYQEYHPALVRILKHLADTFNAAGKGISVCGELAGDPLAVPLLIGLGIHSLSVGFASLAGTKQIVRRLTTEAARQLAEEVLALSTAEDIRRTLLAFSKQLEV